MYQPKASLREYVRGVDGGDLLLVAGLDEFVIYEQAERLCPGLAIGSSKLRLHFSEDGRIVEAGSSCSRQVSSTTSRDTARYGQVEVGFDSVEREGGWER